MQITLLFCISAVATLGTKAFSKLCSDMLSKNSVAKYSLFLIINSLIACAFFFVSGGFRLAVNGMTVLYASLYALVVVVSVVSSLIVYRYASISNVNVTTSACSMICTAIIGWSLFSEAFSIQGVLRLVIMLVAIGLVFLDQTRGTEQKTEGEDADRKGQKSAHDLVVLVILLCVMTLDMSANTIVLKLFADSTRVTDENSFFLLTNVILAIVAAIPFTVACLKRKGELSEAIAMLRPRKLLPVAGNTVCSNICSIVSVLIMAQMDVSIYSPLSSAIGILVGLVGSWIFRERLGIYSYLAAVVSVIVVFL